jgi:hypothetical protein
MLVGAALVMAGVWFGALSPGARSGPNKVRSRASSTSGSSMTATIVGSSASKAAFVGTNTVTPSRSSPSR